MSEERQLRPEAIQLLIVDDHALFRGGLVRLLEAEPDIEVTAAVGTTDEALQVLEHARVDIVLLDYDLGAERGLRLVLEMNQRALTTRVLMVAAGLTDRQTLDLMQHGIAGIVMKADPPESLVEAIRKVMAGGAWLKQDHVRLLAAGGVEQPIAGDKPLSDRERSVLRNVIEGLSNKQIAAQLGISESSVKASLQQLFTRAGVRTRSQLVRIGLEHYRDLVA